MKESESVLLAQEHCRVENIKKKCLQLWGTSMLMRRITSFGIM